MQASFSGATPSLTLTSGVWRSGSHWSSPQRSSRPHADGDQRDQSILHQHPIVLKTAFIPCLLFLTQFQSMQTLLTMIYPKCYRKTIFLQVHRQDGPSHPTALPVKRGGRECWRGLPMLIRRWWPPDQCLCTRSGKRATQGHGSRKLTPHKSFSLLFLSSLDFPYNISGIFWPKCGSSWNLTVNIPESTVLTQLLPPSLPFLGPTCHSWVCNTLSLLKEELTTS